MFDFKLNVFEDPVAVLDLKYGILQPVPVLFQKFCKPRSELIITYIIGYQQHWIPPLSGKPDIPVWVYSA